MGLDSSSVRKLPYIPPPLREAGVSSAAQDGADLGAVFASEGHVPAESGSESMNG